jgi:hypothetical protein
VAQGGQVRAWPRIQNARRLYAVRSRSSQPVAIPSSRSWRKGRAWCRDINISKPTLEGLFVDVLARLQPTPGYMRLVKQRVVVVWDRLRSDVKEKAEAVDRRIGAIKKKLDRLDNAFLFEQTIDIDTYDRHKERPHEELTLLQIDHHATELEELDVEGILAFAERVLPRAADLWVQASLEQRQRLQQLFFPEGIAFDGKAFVRTAVTAAGFNWLQPAEPSKTSLVDLTGIEPVTS